MQYWRVSIGMDRGVTHFVLMPLHFVTAWLICYVCGPTRWVILVFVTVQGGDSCCHWKSRVLVVAWSHLFYAICVQLFKFFFLHVYIIHKYQFIAKLQMVVLAIVICFQHSKWMPINANQCVTSRGYPGPLFSISLYHYQVKDNWIVGQHGLFCKSVAVFLPGTCVNFIPNSEGSLALFLSVVCPNLFCNR
jgi:hypothetical protein